MAATASPAPRRARRQPVAAIEPRAFRAYQLPLVLNISRAYVTRLLATGELPSFTVGSARFVTVADVDAWLARRRAADR
jgi:excisionase family DNA binding protein